MPKFSQFTGRYDTKANVRAKIIVQLNRLRHLRWRRLLTIRNIFIIVVTLISLLRALPASIVPQFHGDVRLLWLIDIGTLVPYIWGMTKLYAGQGVAEKFIGFIVASVTFIAPYWYYYSQRSEDYPAYVNVVVVAFVVSAILKELIVRYYPKLKALKKSESGS